MTLPASIPPPSPTPARAAACAVQRTLRGAGHVAYFAGGCVRDELLGRVPSDYDVATSATPSEIERLFRRTAHVGAHFGVVLVREQDQIIEVATFRTDGAYSDNRRPDSVRFGNPAEDADRRDYTVNALFLDPRETPIAGVPTPPAPRAGERPPALLAAPGGLVLDYVGGLTDLAAKVLRAVGDPEARLREDHLRALRAVRLAAKLDFAIDPATASAIRTHARALRGVSPERIGGELLATLADPHRGRGVELLRDLGMMEAILWGQEGWETSWTLPAHAQARAVRGLAHDAPASVALAAWLLDLGVGGVGGVGGGAAQAPTLTQYRQAARAVRSALCLSNADRDAMLDALEGRVELRSRWGVMGVAARKRLMAGPRWVGGLALLEATEPEIARGLRGDGMALEKDGIGISPQPLITGDDLVVIGIRPGPAYKTILDHLYDAQLEGRLTSRDQAILQSRELAARFGVS